MKQSAALIATQKRFFSPPYFDAGHEEDNLVLARCSEELRRRLKLGEDISEFTLVMFVMRDLICAGHKDIDLDDLIEFLRPRYQAVRDKIKRPHDIDTEVFLRQECVKAYGKILTQQI